MYATARMAKKPQELTINKEEFTQIEVDTLEGMASIRKFDKKHYIYYPQEPSKTVYLLKEGRIKIGTYSPDGKEVIKSIVYPGQLFGELGLIGEERRSDFAKSLNAPFHLALQMII